MNIFFVAAAFAAAQAAPTAPVDHSMHSAQQHAEHQSMDHSKHAEGKHDCKACCDKMKSKDGKMECMDKKGDSKTAAPAPSGHEGHAH